MKNYKVTDEEVLHGKFDERDLCVFPTFLRAFLFAYKSLASRIAQLEKLSERGNG